MSINVYPESASCALYLTKNNVVNTLTIKIECNLVYLCITIAKHKISVHKIMRENYEIKKITNMYINSEIKL